MKAIIPILILSISLMACNNKKDAPSEYISKSKKDKILFVCTNVDTVNGTANGTFLSEISIPFILLEEQNFEIDIVSPEGGEIPIYYKFDTTEDIRKALNSDYYNNQIENTLTPTDVDFQEYQAVILPGGYGQFWDIHNNQKINRLIAQIFENGGAIGALGHGTSSLVNVKLSDGQPLVEGVTMTCFPSWFEKEIMIEADYGNLLPFDMEVELINKGANLLKVDKETRSNGQIVDVENKVITASSATGGRFIAVELIKLLN